MGGFDVPAADIERIERIRSAVSNVAVGIDVNGAWSVDTGIDAMPRLVDEEPPSSKSHCPTSSGLLTCSA
jgi:L-alanine-DL-glutamate epimerase-like enolase superfamily enzyme